MEKAKLYFQIFAAFLAAQFILAALVFFVPPLRDSVITALQHERSTWEPSERIVVAEYFFREAGAERGYTTRGKVYVYECAPQAAQIDVNGIRIWTMRSQLEKDVCLAGQP